MTYQQLLPIYQQQTGKAGQDADFNTWVQGLIDKSGSQNGIEGIPESFVQAPSNSPYTPVSDSAGTGFGGLLTPTSTTTTPTASVTTVPGSNYNQVQNANQTGSFATVGETGVNTKQDTNTSQNTDQTSSTNTNQNGTVTTGVNDGLGFGKLLQDASGTATTNDANRNAFLTDVMQNGGSGFQSQLDQGIRSSLSGPQMSGAGDSARGRAAGYAGAQIGRNNLDQRLGAARDLAGPTSLTTLSGAANPYLGTTQTSNISSDSLSKLASAVSGNSSTTGSSNTNEASTGSTAAGSSQAASGVVPQGQPVKSGGCVICTAGLELSLFRTPRALRRAARHKLYVETSRFSSSLRGYFLLFTPIARFLLRHPTLAALAMSVAKAVVYEELRISGSPLPLRKRAWVYHWVWDLGCRVVGKFVTKDHVSDPVILETARKHKVLFTMEVQS